ncbi:MAG: TonB-dependent receptor [Bacteroides sp.]|nr:TonB-dependent receptor [Bacteroides sp.]
MRKNLLFVFSMLLLSALSFAQNSITVSGIVTEKKTGESIIGATVQVKGQTLGTITGLDGDYKLVGVPSQATLIVSYIGMKPQEIKLNGSSTVNVSLEEDNLMIDEVVVVGYGVQRKSDLTGAVGSIKREKKKKVSTSNVANALQGRVSGVFISANGAPGSSPEVRIRGIGTTNNSNPLYVVDGMFMEDITFLNTHDIESMEVLKDASATAMYGSRGANGVIIVTTKQGAEGKAVVNVLANEGFQFQNSNFEMASASEYATLLNEALKNTGGTPKFDDPASLGRGTNWFDEIFRVASVREYQVSVSGGSEKVRYNLSAGYYKQDGIIKGNSYDRFTIRANNSYKLNKRLTFGHNLSASFSHKLNENKSVVKSAYTISPVKKPYNEDGSFMDSESASSANPVASLHYTNNDDWKDRIVGSAFLNWEVLKGLNFKTSLGIDYLNGQYRNFTPEYYVSETQKNTSNSLTKRWSRDFTWLWENLLTYDWQINANSRLNLLGGITAQKRKYEQLEGFGRDFFSNNDNYWYLDQASVDSKSVGNNGYHEAMMSYLFRANYALMDRYLLTASMRADGSSKFGPNNRWGYFPSAAIGWRVSEEAFVKENATWLSNLKLRGSWGQIGNDKIGNDKYNPLANINPSYDAIFGGIYFPGGTVTSLSNKSIHWERSEQMDLGFDLGLFNNRLAVEFDYYQRDTKDMLVTVDVPGSVGLTPVETNVGAVRNSGIDFTVKWADTYKDFNYSVRLTGTTIKNEVIDLGGKRIASGDIGAGKSVQMTEEGMPIKYFYGYKVIGIFQSDEQIKAYNDKAAALSGKPGQKYQNNVAPGDLIYEDVDGSGYITAEDRKDLGSPTPKFIGGLGLTASWRGFDLAVDFQGNFGNKIFNAKQVERFSGADNWDRSFLDRWTPENTGASIPRMTLEGNNYLASDRYIESGSYVKLQTVELGYTFPKLLMQKIHVQNLRLYVSGNNLAYFTGYNGFTPEVLGGLDREIYPVTATCRFGLNLTF